MMISKIKAAVCIILLTCVVGTGAEKEKWLRGQTGAGGTKYGRVIPEGPSDEAPNQPWPIVSYGPEAEKEFAIKREAVFEFVGKPTVSAKLDYHATKRVSLK